MQSKVITKDTMPQLLGTHEVAGLLGWDKRKVSVYMSRGKLPEPIARLKSGPVWNKANIVEFIQTEQG